MKKYLLLIVILFSKDISIQNTSLLEIGQEAIGLSREVHATVYNAVAAQCDKNPDRTAFMFKLDLGDPYKHRVIAVSRDLLDDFPNGTLVHLSGTDYDGEYVVRDKMNKRFTNRIDILINQDMKVGSWENVKITKIK